MKNIKKKIFLCFFVLGVFLCHKSQTISSLAGIGIGTSPLIDSVRVDSIIPDANPAIASKLYFPYGIATDTKGNVYVAEHFSNMVRCIKPDGLIYIIAGNGKQGIAGDNIAAVNAPLNLPSAVAADTLGNIYFAEWGANMIRKVDKSGLMTIIAGNGTPGYSGDGGPATSAQINSPSGIALDQQGNIYFTEYGNNIVRKVIPGGTISTFAGTGVRGCTPDPGAKGSCMLSFPHGLAFDGQGNLYVADAGNNKIRKIDLLQGSISTIAGTGVAGFSGDNGQAHAAQLNFPQGIAIDASGNIFITDAYNNRIRKINTSGVIQTITGGDTKDFGGDDGPASIAPIAGPVGIAVDNTGAVYFTDTFNNRIRVVK